MNTYVTYLFDSPPRDLNPSTVFFSMMKRLNFITGPGFLEDESSPWTLTYFKYQVKPLKLSLHAEM